MKEQDLKILPFPRKVRLDGGFVQMKPYVKTPKGRIGSFIPEEGDREVKFLQNSALPPEGYRLTIYGKGVEISASAYAGFLYGAIVLDMLVKQFGTYLPCLYIEDEPMAAHRGTQVCYAQINVKYREKWLKKHIVDLAKLRVNYLYLYLEWDYAFPSLPPLSGKEMMTPEDAREIVAFAKGYNIKIVPACNVLGHTSDFLAVQYLNDCKENMDGETNAKVSTARALCPNNPRANAIVFRALDDLIDAFQPEIIHIGGDEVEHIGGDKYCRAEAERLGRTGVLLSYFVKIRDYLQSRGVITGIWGDKLLSLSEENRYDGEKCEEKYLPKNLELLDDFRHGTIVYDWWYTGGSEKSIRFFSEKKFNVISAASVHGCMTSIPSFDQQLNIRALFIDALDYGVKGGLVCDWINGMGYHAEQAYFNFAAGAAMLWSGTDKDSFIVNCSREKFEKDSLFVRYGTTDTALIDYFHEAGDIYGKLLSLFPPDRKGVSIRKSVFYTDNPLTVYIKNITDLDGKLGEYEKSVRRISVLYKKAEKSCKDDGYFYALKVAAVAHGYILRAVSVMDKFYGYYDAAAKVQYTDGERFGEYLDLCAQTLETLKGAYVPPIRFAAWMHENLGLEESSVYRLKGARKNLSKLIRFILRLKGNYRPLPAIARISDSLFGTDRDVWWKMRDYEWIEEEGEFKKYDVELGFYYERLDWSHIKEMEKNL